MFVAITACCFNWAVIIDMIMAVVIPPRRNTAISWQILISHLFGDASGPYIVGMISDAIRKDDSSPLGNFNSLVTSFYLPNFLLICSAILFFCAVPTFVKDNTKFKKAVGVLQEESAAQEYITSPHEEEDSPPRAEGLQSL
ncbi:hypothetical protein OESDEN_08493 [Oesophagostomum dentatum]|uniref:Major facilitator superfamily (MFS) profile domain-containing protein n=1 Tax=Oesophagostomum dentatum TaxID=61180 RepID=A0A0B1T7A2_OESDE|nr:hypothetical protein OESDEN_08493 [Oesophagostomum dentatum]